VRLSDSRLLKLGLPAVGLLVWILVWPGADSVPPGRVREVPPNPVNSSSDRLTFASRSPSNFSGGRRFRGTSPTRSSPRQRPPSRGASNQRPSRQVENNLARLSKGEFEERKSSASATPPKSGPARPPRPTPASQEAPSRRNEMPLGLAAGGGLAGELDQLDRGYEAAQNLLFSGFRGAPTNPTNPFDQALDDSQPETPADPTPTDDGDTTETDDSPGDETPPTEGDSGDNSDGPEGGDPAPPDTSAPEKVLDFLMVGIPGSSALIQRASFDGSNFVLEDGSQLGFFVGGVRSLLSFDLNSSLVIEDFNRDGRDDFCLIREVPSVGTGIELFEQDTEGAFHVVASLVLYLQRVQSAVLFDIEADGELELLVGLDGESRLFVYERDGSNWHYSREFILPIVPALMFVSRAESINLERQLQIIDPALQVVLTARSESPVAFSLGFGTPLQKMGSLAVDFYHTGDTQPNVRFIQLEDRLVLFEERNEQPVAYASLERRAKAPVLLIGDYSRLGNRELIWLP